MPKTGHDMGSSKLSKASGIWAIVVFIYIVKKSSESSLKYDFNAEEGCKMELYEPVSLSYVTKNMTMKWNGCNIVII